MGHLHKRSRQKTLHLDFWSAVYQYAIEPPKRQAKCPGGFAGFRNVEVALSCVFVSTVFPRQVCCLGTYIIYIDAIFVSSELLIPSYSPPPFFSEARFAQSRRLWFKRV